MTAFSSLEIQLGLWGLLFLGGTLGYFWISTKLKDPRKIYEPNENKSQVSATKRA